MGVEEFRASVKKRRQERLRLLKRKQRIVEASKPERGEIIQENMTDKGSFDSLFTESAQDMKRKGLSSSFMLKIVCSLVLFLAVYLIMTSENSQFKDAQGFIQEVMERDYNVEGLLTWYENVTGESPQLLPQIIQRPSDTQLVQQDYTLPVNGGVVVTTFGQGSEGITLGTSSRVPIEVIKEGLVISAEEKEGLGFTIVIDHGDGEESWYGHLQNSRVRVNDWVQQGDVIGHTTISSESGQGLFYFALRRNNMFINPLDVISFD